jgi:pyruvate/2-oxoglutarate/acetoin dehydrogenase E1 component
MMDQLANQAAKMRYMSAGTLSVPLVMRAPGGGDGARRVTCAKLEAFFTHVPGLKVVCPATAYDAKGLLISAIRDPDPVLFFEPKRVYRAARGRSRRAEYTVPLGKARVTREAPR